MTDQSLRRADELLTELVELVETARTLPMSSSCVLPARAHARPARRAARGAAAGDGRGPHGHRQPRRAAARRLRRGGRGAREGRRRGRRRWPPNAATRAERDRRTTPRCRPTRPSSAGKAEHATLVSATTIHQAAARAAAALRERGRRATHAGCTQQADAVPPADAAPRPTATRADTRAEAERYAAKLTADAEDYADRTLSELAATLQRAAAHRRAGPGRARPAPRRRSAGSGRRRPSPPTRCRRRSTTPGCGRRARRSRG